VKVLKNRFRRKMMARLGISYPVLRLIALWAIWAVVVLGFQTLVETRYAPNRPDRALSWTPEFTARTSQNDKPYLIDPFMNRQVSFDSEFYLSIALAGYDDPVVRTASTPGGTLSLNYAFFPLYPLLMRAVAVPLGVFGLEVVAGVTAAGVILSLLGALLALIALHDLDPEIGARSTFYLLIFPTAFYMTMVYTEGLFIGLAFAALALARRRAWILAGGMAALAVWTRSVGVVLVVPLALIWLGTLNLRALRFSPALFIGMAGVLLPVGAYLVWNAVLGERFGHIQVGYFGRASFNLYATLTGFSEAWNAILRGSILNMRAYYLLEIGVVLLAIAAIVLGARRYPVMALTSALLLVVPLTSGAPQSLIRYVLPLPIIYLTLGRLCEHPLFDRAWTLISLLLFGMLVSLFTFDMWVA
jgi:Gpi18-like mannosyltransferase